jgi:hypothetical protein
LRGYKCPSCDEDGIAEYINKKDYSKILCKVHKARNEHHFDYIRIDSPSIQEELDKELNKLELMFIDMNICLSIVQKLIDTNNALK